MLSHRLVMVLGAGRSGRAAAVLARDRGARVILSDSNPNATPLEGVENAMGHHPVNALAVGDLMVVSPGISVNAEPVQAALAAGVEVVGELGFAASQLPPGRTIIAITGTNGKSTVTWFTAGLLLQAGRRVFVGGNLGTPLSASFDKEWDIAVVEVSSYQLELPGSFQPDVAAILNLSPDHLERHGTLENYAAHKCRLVHALSEHGLALLPLDDSLLSRLTEGHPGETAWLDSMPGVLIKENVACLEQGEVDLSGLGAPGALNRWNAGVACFLAASVGVDIEELSVDGLTALPHRMEPVAESNGVVWINDSKATNVEATARGLEGLDGPMVVLLGGQGKAGSDYGQLLGVLRERARAVVCFGASAAEISGSLSELNPSCVAGLDEAVSIAREMVREGDLVILSPACASFDEFVDYADRGAAFRRLANDKSAQSAAGRMS